MVGRSASPHIIHDLASFGAIAFQVDVRRLQVPVVGDRPGPLGAVRRSDLGQSRVPDLERNPGISLVQFDVALNRPVVGLGRVRRLAFA